MKKTGSRGFGLEGFKREGVILILLTITVGGILCTRGGAMERHISVEASWVGPSTESIAHLMVFTGDINYLNVKLA